MAATVAMHYGFRCFQVSKLRKGWFEGSEKSMILTLGAALLLRSKQATTVSSGDLLLFRSAVAPTVGSLFDRVPQMPGVGGGIGKIRGGRAHEGDLASSDLIDPRALDNLAALEDGRARFITADALAAYVVRLESEAAEVV
jgi:hypothetical protein